MVFAPYLSAADHLARHAAADLFLDTAPCNAHTTASDALWAGLPLVTLAGNTFAGRVAASLLCAIGLPQLVAKSVDAYEDLVLGLALEPSKLSAIRKTLAENRLSHPLFDTKRFAKQLETRIHLDS